MVLDDPRWQALLYEIFDGLMAELERKTPAQVGQAPSLVASRAGTTRTPSPALKTRG